MKVAFCLFGLVGSSIEKYGLGEVIDYRIGHHFHKKYIFDNNDVDIFVHSWSTDFEKEIIDIYKPKKHIVEKQIDFGQGSMRQNSFASRWYSMAMSNQLKGLYEQENNFKYDFVMLSRFDYIFNKNLIFKDFDNNHFYISHKHECYNNDCQCKNSEIYSDPWFFGNSMDVDLFSTLYEKWGEYGIGNSHKEVAYHIKETGLKSKLKHFFYDRYDHYPVRCQFINCEYTGKDFDVSNLKIFEWGEGYAKRTKTPDVVE